MRNPGRLDRGLRRGPDGRQWRMNWGRRYARFCSGGGRRRELRRVGRKRNRGHGFEIRRLRRHRLRGRDRRCGGRRIDRRRKWLCSRRIGGRRRRPDCWRRQIRLRRMIEREVSVRVDWLNFGTGALARTRLRDVAQRRPGPARSRDGRIASGLRCGRALRCGCDGRCVWQSGFGSFEPEDRAQHCCANQDERRNPKCPGPGASSRRQIGSGRIVRI